MADKIIHLRSLTAGSIPTTSSLGVGQFAINVPDGQVYLRKSSSVEDVIVSAITTNSQNSGSVVLSGSLLVSGSITVQGPITGSVLANPYGDLILTASGSSIASGSVEIHGGLKWKRTPTAVATEIGDLITFGATVGAIDGGTLTTASIGGYVVQVSEMVAYTMTTFPYSQHNLTKFDTYGTSDASRQLTLPQTSSNYVYYNNSGTLTYGATVPSSRSNIILGKVTTDDTKVIYIDAAQINAHHYSNYLDRMLREALGPIFYTGAIVTQGTVSGSLNVTAATYYFTQTRITTNGASPVTMHSFYRGATSGQFVRTTGVTTVSTSSYDNNTNSLTSIPSGKYVKHSLYLLGDNALQATANEEYLLVYGQTLYDTIGDAVAGTLPTPPSYFTDQTVIIASIVVTPDSSSIQQIIDERPRLGFVSPSKTGVITAHGDLTGLANDDHPQYLLTDGSRTLTGNMNLGNHNISNVNTLTATAVTSSLFGTSSWAVSASWAPNAGTASYLLGNASASYVQFSQVAGATPAVGRLQWDDIDGTLQLGLVGGNVNLQVGQEMVAYVFNAEATTLNDGEVVYVSGSQGDKPRVYRASSLDSTSLKYEAFGVVTEPIASSGTGFVTKMGFVNNLNLAGLGFTVGDTLWLGTSLGTFTNVKPSAPTHSVEIGTLTRLGVGNNSSIYVDIVHGSTLGGTDSNVAFNNLSNGDLIVYNSGSGIWTNSQTLSSSYHITASSVYTTNLNITGSLTLSVPTYNTSSREVLVRNSTSGEVEYNYPSHLTSARNVIRVGMSGSAGVDYYSVKAAVDSITDATSTNPYIVQVRGGLYKEDPITMKSYVVVVGMNSTATIIEATSASLTLINGADQSMIQDVQLQGCTGSNAAAVEYKSATTPQTNAIFYVENVRFGPNYTHARTVGTGGGNCIMQCSNVKYGGYNFTTGFHVTNDGSGIGRMQLRNVTSTNGGVVTTTGLVFAKADKPGCTFIVNGCLLTKAVGAAAGTGFLAYDGASLRLTAVNFQRWDKAIYMPQSGSAPSIFGSALNFENDTLDIVVEHTGSTGKIDGSDTFLKTQINFSSSLYLVNKDARKITVAKKGGDFSSIKSAVDYITDSSENNRYVVSVGPGAYYEQEINLVGKPYVSIVGSNIQTTEIYPSGSNQNLIKIGIDNEISFLSLTNAPSGYSAILCDDIGDFAQVHKISFYNCDTNIKVISRTKDTQFFGEYIDFNGTYSYGTVVSGSNGFYALANLENYYQYPSGSANLIANYAQGTADLDIRAAVFAGEDEANSIALQLSDGANTEGTALDIQGWGTGIKVLNSGNSSSFDIVGSMVHNSVNYDFNVLHPNASGRFQGTAEHNMINNASNDFFWNFLDKTDGELDITRNLAVTFADGTHTDASTLIFKGSPMGVMQGGAITISGSLTINTEAGFGYLQDSVNSSSYHRYDWVDSILALPANSECYIHIDDTGALSYALSEVDYVTNIVLGRVITNATGIEIIEQAPYDGRHTANKLSEFNKIALGSVYANGSIVSDSGSFKLNVSAGTYYFSENRFDPTGGNGITFTQYFRSASVWDRSVTSTVVHNVFDSGSNALVAMSASAYTKHTLYVVGEGVDEKYMMVVGQTEYPTLVQAENAGLPTIPTYFEYAIVPIASIYVQSGSAGIVQIQDIRPVIGFKAAGVNAASVHANLIGLSSDDHKQYLLTSGVRAMDGNLNMGGFDITNASIITSNAFTGSLFGTASYAVNALTSSYTTTALTATNATSASYAATASVVVSSSFATTASYASSTPNTGRQITSYVPFIATAGQTVTLTRLVAAVTEIGTETRIKTDLTYVASCSLSVRVEQATVLTGPQIRVQYSTDEVTWNYLTANATNYPTVALNATGTTYTGKEAIVSGAKGVVTLRLVTVGGDGTNNSTARVGNITLSTIYNL